MDTSTRLCINGHVTVLEPYVAYRFETATHQPQKGREFTGTAIERFFVGVVHLDSARYVEVRSGDGILHLIPQESLTRVTALGRSLLEPDTASHEAIAQDAEVRVAA